VGVEKLKFFPNDENLGIENVHATQQLVRRAAWRIFSQDVSAMSVNTHKQYALRTT
jgi:hypothetical protein